MRLVRRWFFPVLLCLAARPAAAQLRSFSVTSDNDAYNFWVPVDTRQDEEYTSGIELAARLDGAPLWGRLVRAHPACAGADSTRACLSTGLHLGQKIFTPRIDSLATARERPYAGWLYVAASGAVEGARRRRSAGVEAGVTGPPSHGEWVQSTLHRLGGFQPVPGWKGQLRTEPGVVLRYGEEYLAAELRPRGLRVAEAVPFWGAAAGNVLTGAHAGVRLRAGYAIPHPWSRAARHGRPSVYAVAAARADLIARDLFLDGNTFRDGPRVERVPLVGRLEAGGGLRLGAAALEYRAFSRSRSYRTEPAGHQYSSFSVTIQTR